MRWAMLRSRWGVLSGLLLGAVVAATASGRVVGACLGPAGRAAATEPQAPVAATLEGAGSPPSHGGYPQSSDAGAARDGGDANDWDEAAEGGLDAGDLPARRKGRRGSSGARRGAISRLGRGSYRVEKGWVEEMISQGATRGVQAMPVFEGERIVGYRLVGVAGSPLGPLGLRDGDVLTAVNGRALSSPDAALAAFQSARNAARVNVRLRRGRGSLSLAYRIEE